MSDRVERISRERLSAAPGELYTRTVLEPSYRFMLDRYLGPLTEASLAWTVMLVERGIVDPAPGARLLGAISELAEGGREAMGEFDPGLEYFYSHHEAFLIARVGEEVAGEVNIGRTRPEPLARMHLRELILGLGEQVARIRGSLVDLAEREAETVMAQWTHQQQAQVSTLGHWALAVEAGLARDAARLDRAFETTNDSTLGCGALAGSSYPVDRERVAELLGFDGVVRNTIDCVAAGDYMLEAASACAGAMVTLSRACQDLYTWHTEEFGLIEIGDEFSGSSSMMPQKKNPYPFEYARARAARSIGELTAAHATLHNTDLQDLKDVEEELPVPVFRALEEATETFELIDGALGTLEPDRERMLRSAAHGFGAATELAALVHRRSELSYRTAHRIVGNLVLRAFNSGLAADEVGAELLDDSAQEIADIRLGFSDEEVRAALDPRRFVESHALAGGPAPEATRAGAQAARERLAADRERIGERRDRIDTARRELELSATRLRSG